MTDLMRECDPGVHGAHPFLDQDHSMLGQPQPVRGPKPTVFHGDTERVGVFANGS